MFSDKHGEILNKVFVGLGILEDRNDNRGSLLALVSLADDALIP